MAIFDELKSIGKVLQEAGKIEQFKQILEAQKELNEMQNKIFELETKNKELEAKLKIKEALVYNKDKKSYWAKEGDGPFCSRCWDVDKKDVRLNSIVDNPAFSICPECETEVQTDPNYRPPFTSKMPPNQYT